MSDGKQGYNGWTNFETWCVSLWIDNDPGSYEMAREIIKGVQSIGDAAEALQDWIEEDNPLQDQASLYADLLNAALRQVNWYEIVESYKDE